MAIRYRNLPELPNAEIDLIVEKYRGLPRLRCSKHQRPASALAGENRQSIVGNRSRLYRQFAAAGRSAAGLRLVFRINFRNIRLPGDGRHSRADH
jgi:hypothetical protein